MKKINPNILTFVLAGVFVLSAFSGQRILFLGRCAKQYLTDLISREPYAFGFLQERVENEIADLWYSDQLRDLYSAAENLSGRRIVRKADEAEGETVVVKTDSGSLITPQEENSEDDVRQVTRRIKGFQTIAEDNGAHFLYCPVPDKAIYEQAPPNAVNRSRENYGLLLEDAAANGIPTVDLSRALREKGIPESELFYYTDHHWRTTTGFAVTAIICEELRSRYGFSFDENYTDLENYRVERYPDWFLGSYGKKVGKYFTWRGADDFDLILPAFPTDFTEYRSDRKNMRSGPFEDSLLYKNRLEYDPYNVNTYAIYGGNYRLQVLYNNLRPELCKILMIRESYACVITPFLALQAGELHAVDLREGSYPTGEIVDIQAYIREHRPDYVIVLE